MIVAVASGKGGTGKTTIAVNLAAVASLEDENVTYIDCDVEEPNGHIFLKPIVRAGLHVTVPVPGVDLDKCTRCGRCARFCRFNAIAMIGDSVMTFPDLCHGCGGCTRICPEEAITESPRVVGRIESGRAGLKAGGDPSCAKELKVMQGILNVREPMAGPVIRKLKSMMPSSGLRVLDVPPGTSCPVVESVRGSDYVVLVAESTPFGLNDLEIAVDVMKALDLPMGVVINRSGLGDDRVSKFCHEEGIDVLLEIPDDRRIAEIYSRGGLLSLEIPWFRNKMAELLERICAMVN